MGATIVEVQLTDDQLLRLSRMATALGRQEQWLIQEAVERLLNYDDWFSHEVDTGVEAADRGEFIEHDEVRRLIDRRYPA